MAMLILTIIPVFNAFAPLGWFLLGAWMMSLQFVDYPMGNHRLPFREVHAKPVQTEDYRLLDLAAP